MSSHTERVMSRDYIDKLLASGTWAKDTATTYTRCTGEVITRLDSRRWLCEFGVYGTLTVALFMVEQKYK